MSQDFFGELLKERRRSKKLTQDDMARILGTTRANYSHWESGRRKDVLTPEQARLVSRHLGIDMLTLVNAMGYNVNPPGLETPEEAEVLSAYRLLDPRERRFLRRGLGLET